MPVDLSVHVDPASELYFIFPFSSPIQYTFEFEGESPMLLMNEVPNVGEIDVQLDPAFTVFQSIVLPVNSI